MNIAECKNHRETTYLPSALTVQLDDLYRKIIQVQKFIIHSIYVCLAGLTCFTYKKTESDLIPYISPNPAIKNAGCFI